VRADLLISGRVALADGGDPLPGWVALAGDRIAGAGAGATPDTTMRLIELGELVVAPGFVDVHVHGGAGGQAAGGEAGQVADGVRRTAVFHATHGTTCLLATTVSDTPERLRAAVAGIRAAIDDPDPAGAVVAGVHLEGPWLAPLRRGAHDPATLRQPDAGELDALVRVAGDAVRLLTLAPELPGAGALIAAAARHGIVVSVGHTEATHDQAHAAFDTGARHLTHLGNAMRALDRREPGPIGAALTDDRVTVEVIADGHHVHPAVLALVARAAPERLVAITDAIAAAGLPDGAHRLGALPVTVRDGRAVLTEQPGTLAGSVLTMDGAVAGLVAAGVAPGLALRAATATPARVVLADTDRGVLAAGARADLVVLDGAFRARATVIGGRAVHDPERLLAQAG
jgi:N-acetylglucosamine-6-phosphate deacetylase